MLVMKIKVALYIISAVLATLALPMVLILIYLELIEADITSRFMWAISIGCCVISILTFTMARILVMWMEEDENIEE